MEIFFFVCLSCKYYQRNKSSVGIFFLGCLARSATIELVFNSVTWILSPVCTGFLTGNTAGNIAQD
jgi:hypothetical protein